MGEVECDTMPVASNDNHKPLVWEKKRGRTRQPWMRVRRDSKRMLV